MIDMGLMEPRGGNVMLRSQKGKESFDTLKRGVSLVALLGLLFGVLSGASVVSTNLYRSHGLDNLAIAVFAHALNATFLKIILVGLPIALLLYFLHRVVRRSFRALTAILSAAALLVLISRYGLWSNGLGGETETGRLVSLIMTRFILVLISFGIGRLVYDGFTLLHSLVRIVPFRAIIVTLFLLGAANSADYINHTKNFPRGPNVILITIDAIRPDHLGTYGYSRPVTPNIDRLAREGILFSHSYTVSPRETQAISSILTGRYPRAMGVQALWDQLGAEEVTMAELLRDRGYGTGAFASLLPPVGDSGFRQGFDHWETANRFQADRVTGAAIDWISERNKRPFHAWLHYSDPSMPYRSATGSAEFDYGPTRGCLVFGHTMLDSAVVDRALQLYDEEIRFVDRQIGRLISFLEETDRLHNSLILLAGTTGESFGDHDYRFDHGEYLYDSGIQVPFILSAANLPKRIIESQVRTIDLFPTMIDVLHFDPLQDLQGKSLLGVIERPETHDDRVLYAESGESLTPRFNSGRPVATVHGKLRAIRTGEWKLIVTPGGGDRTFELYNMLEDPAESLNVWQEESGVSQELQNRLDSWLKETPAPPWNGGPPPDWVLDNRLPVIPEALPETSP